MQVFGSVEQMNESVVTQLGCISQGFSEPELEKLPFLLDNLEEIGRCGWTETQVMMTSGVKNIQKKKKKKEISGKSESNYSTPLTKKSWNVQVLKCIHLKSFCKKLFCFSYCNMHTFNRVCIYFPTE